MKKIFLICILFIIMIPGCTPFDVGNVVQVKGLKDRVRLLEKRVDSLQIQIDSFKLRQDSLNRQQLQ